MNKKNNSQDNEKKFCKKIRLLVNREFDGDREASKQLASYLKIEKYKLKVQSIRNKVIKQRKTNTIHSLIVKVRAGDILAEKFLAQEIANDPHSRKIVEKAILKWEKKRKKGLLSSKVKSRKKRPIYGNAYKTYQGGIPGLGKRT